MARSPIIISIATAILAFSLLGYHAAFTKEESDWNKSHVLPGQHARDLMNSQPAPSTAQEAIRQLVRLLHDHDHFIHIDRNLIDRFRKPSFSIDSFKDTMQAKIAQLEAQLGGGIEKEEKLYELRVNLTTAEAYIQTFSKCTKKDLPFCCSGEEYVRLKMIDGCTSFAKTFITLANAASPKLFDDVRLLVTKSLEDIKKNINLLGTNTLPTENIDGHQMVLVKDKNVWYLVNVVFYRIGLNTGVEEFEIFDQIDGKPVDPDTILYKRITLPSEQGDLHRLVAAAVGKNRNDDLGVHTWEDSTRLAIAIPPDTFKKQ